MKKKQLALLFGILSVSFTFGQIEIQKNNFKQTVTNPTSISVCDTNNFGFSVPLDATLKKYDKVVFLLQARKKGSSGAFEDVETGMGTKYAMLSELPTTKGFEDRNEGKRSLNVCIKSSSGTTLNPLFLIENFCGSLEKAEYYTSYEYRGVVKGFFENGTETYWSDYSETIKTRTLYKYSKDVYQTVTFSFVLAENDQQQVNKKDNERKQQQIATQNRKKTFLEIEQKYTVYATLPVVGTVQPRIEIFNAYLLLRKELLKNEDYETLDKVDAKLMAINKSFQKLNKLLKNQKDTTKIKNQILDF